MADPRHLLELPVEILRLVLEHLVVSASPIPMCPCSRASMATSPLPYLLIHPSLYNMAAPLLYSKNRFVLDTTGFHAHHVQEMLDSGRGPRRAAGRGGGSFLLATPAALQRIVALEVRLDRLRGWLSEAMVPLLQTMILQGRLEQLGVWVRNARAEGPIPLAGDSRIPPTDADLRAGMFGRPPLSAVLRVLADPYLRSARLWVDGLHAAIWCRYHPDRPPCPPGIADRPAALGRHGRPLRVDAEELRRVEIDWRAILRAVDPEGRLTAIAWAEDPALMRLH